MAGMQGRASLAAKGIWHRQGKVLVQVALIAYLPALLVIAVAALQPGIPPSVLFEDPAATLDTPFFVGILSHTGVLFWAAAATICLFTSAILRRTGGEMRLVRFFLASGLLTGYLMWDDLLMFHERLFPVYLSIREGIPKGLVLVAILAYLVYYRATILRSQYALLGLSLAFLGLSFAVDVSVVQDFVKERTGISFESYYYLEDGPKLLGIVGWFAYFAVFAADALAGRLAAGGAASDTERADSSRRQPQGDEVRSRIG
jgi:hypothetical protein